jgi:YVTN family beta-propeller protein
VRLATAVIATCLLPFLTQAADPAFAVIEKVAGRVSFYDAAFRRIGETRVGAFPHEAVLSPDRRTLYVSVNGVLWMTEDAPGNNSIAVVDVPSMKKVADIDLGRFHRPHGLAIDPATGTLLSTTERPFGLVAIDTATRKVIRDYDVKGKSPHMVMLSNNGSRAWVSNTDSNSMAAVDLKSGTTKVVPTGEGPQGGVLDKSGNRLYVTNAGPGRIAVIDTKSAKEVARIPTGKSPGRVAITPDGRTLVYNISDGGRLRRHQNPQAGQRHRPARPSLIFDPQPRRQSAPSRASKSRTRSASSMSPAEGSRSVIDVPKGSGPDPIIPIE